MTIRFKIKRTVLLSALKVLKQVLPFSRRAGEGVSMEIKIKEGSLTMRCTVASVTLPCESEGEGKIVTLLNYFWRIVSDHRGKFFECTCENNKMRFKKTAVGGIRLYALTKGSEYVPDPTVPTSPPGEKRPLKK